MDKLQILVTGIINILAPSFKNLRETLAIPAALLMAYINIKDLNLNLLKLLETPCSKQARNLKF